MAPTPEEQEAAMAEWGAWFGALGPAVAEPGNPFGESKTVSSDGSISEGGGADAVTGYSVLTAASVAAAADLAKGCPVLKSGGRVAVYEAIEM
jgi:hypothetical protein